MRCHEVAHHGRGEGLHSKRAISAETQTSIPPFIHAGARIGGGRRRRDHRKPSREGSQAPRWRPPPNAGKKHRPYRHGATAFPSRAFASASSSLERRAACSWAEPNPSPPRAPRHVLVRRDELSERHAVDDQAMIDQQRNQLAFDAPREIEGRTRAVLQVQREDVMPAVPLSSDPRHRARDHGLSHAPELDQARAAPRRGRDVTKAVTPRAPCMSTWSVAALAADSSSGRTTVHPHVQAAKATTC